jgi:hypothetical protein
MSCSALAGIGYMVYGENFTGMGITRCYPFRMEFFEVNDRTYYL